MSANSESWQQETQFRLDLLRLAAAADQRSPEEVEKAEWLAQFVRTRRPSASE